MTNINGYNDIQIKTKPHINLWVMSGVTLFFKTDRNNLLKGSRQQRFSLATRFID